MAGSPMSPVPTVSNLGFGAGGVPDVNTTQGWLQTYYPNHEWLQPGNLYGPPASFSGNPAGSSPSTGQFDTSTEKGWLQTYYPSHPDLQAGGKYGSASYPYGAGMGFGLGDPGFGSIPTGQMPNIDFGLGLPPAQTPITGMTEQEWERAFAPNAPDLQPGGKYYTGGGGGFGDFGMGSTTGMNQDYAAGVAPTSGYSIQPGTAAATFGGGMTAQDAAAQAQTYNDLQNRLASEAAFYAAQAAALPSSPQNYASQIVAPYDRNFGGQIQGYNPFSTQYQAY